MNGLMLVASLSLLPGITALIYESYRAAACGEMISTNSGIELPSGKTCDIGVHGIQGQIAVIDIFWETKSLEKGRICDGLKIVDNISGKEHNMCTADDVDTFFFQGTSSYTLKMTNLPEGILVHVSYMSPKFSCGERVSYKHIGVPVEVTNPGNPACILAVPPATIVRIEMAKQSKKSSSKCVVSLEMNQGTHFAQLISSSGVQCLDDESLDFPVICQAGILFFGAAEPATIKLTVLPLTVKELSSFADLTGRCYPQKA